MIYKLHSIISKKLMEFLIYRLCKSNLFPDEGINVILYLLKSKKMNFYTLQQKE